MSKLSGGRKLLLCLVILGVIAFTQVNVDEGKVMVAMVVSFGAANAVEHYTNNRRD